MWTDLKLGLLWQSVVCQRLVDYFLALRQELAYVYVGVLVCWCDLPALQVESLRSTCDCQAAWMRPAKPRGVDEGAVHVGHTDTIACRCSRIMRRCVLHEDYMLAGSTWERSRTGSCVLSSTVPKACVANHHYTMAPDAVTVYPPEAN